MKNSGMLRRIGWFIIPALCLSVRISGIAGAETDVFSSAVAARIQEDATDAERIITLHRFVRDEITEIDTRYG